MNLVPYPFILALSSFFQETPPPEGKHTKFPAFSPVPPKKPKPKAGGAGSALLDL